jgi:hypothetical protein
LQVQVRVQLDTIAISPRIADSVSLFNSEHDSVQITLVPTPAQASPSDISFDRPTLAADGRWSDFSGTTMDDISIYKDPKNRHVQHLMHYRRDVFDRFNVSAVPQTWDELLELAARLNGTDFDGDGTPDFALCYNAQMQCRASYMLTKILLSMLFYDGSIKPLYLEPDTLEPVVMNAAMAAALRVMTRLSAYNDPSSSRSCLPYDAKFCKGIATALLRRQLGHELGSDCPQCLTA